MVAKGRHVDLPKEYEQMVKELCKEFGFQSTFFNDKVKEVLKFFYDNKEVHHKTEELHAEIRRLKQQLAEKTKSEKAIEVDGIFPCLARFEDDGEFYCVNRKANAMQLSTLKICGSCQWRIEKDTTKLVKKKFIAMCGAKEHIDKKKGLMLYCEKHFQGQWVTPQDCKTAKCLDLKEMKTT